MTYLVRFFVEQDWNAVIYIVNLAIVFAIIFLERKNPSATLAWILVLFVLPVLGIFLYLIFSQNISRQKIYKLTDKEIRVIRDEVQDQMDCIDKDEFEFSSEVAKKWRQMIKLNQVYGEAFLTQNNQIEILTDGKEMFDRLIRDISRATQSVNIMSYIIRDDKIGRKLIETLTDKAREGVEVRLLVDAMGSRSITDRKLADFIKAGGQTAYFFKPKLKYVTLKLNYRNHRKIAVIDGRKGYIGGFNIAREYLGYKRKFGYWRDTHIRIKGSAVQDLHASFALDWRVASKESLDISHIYFSPVQDKGNSAIQIVDSGPNSPREEIKRGMMRMITFAERNVYLQTPYFVPDPSMLESLKMAAQSGVDVRIMIPCMPDHIFVYWATYAYCGELIKSGARVFIYDAGFLHAKTLVVDGEVATVGSANFDRRSFRLNFEANAFIYDEAFAHKMEEIFEDDIHHGHELTLEEYENRSVIIKFKEAVSRLLSDIL